MSSNTQEVAFDRCTCPRAPTVRPVHLTPTPHAIPAAPLQSPNLAEKPIALVLTKYDLPSLMSRAELDMVMALSDLQVSDAGGVL